MHLASCGQLQALLELFSSQDHCPLLVATALQRPLISQWQRLAPPYSHLHWHFQNTGHLLCVVLRDRDENFLHCTDPKRPLLKGPDVDKINTAWRNFDQRAMKLPNKNHSTIFAWTASTKLLTELQKNFQGRPISLACLGAQSFCLLHFKSHTSGKCKKLRLLYKAIFYFQLPCKLLLTEQANVLIFVVQQGTTIFALLRQVCRRLFDEHGLRFANHSSTTVSFPMTANIQSARLVSNPFCFLLRNWERCWKQNSALPTNRDAIRSLTLQLSHEKQGVLPVVIKSV